MKKTKVKKDHQLVLSPWYTVALYSDSGVGKTTCAATAPRPIFLDSNFGMLSIDGVPGFEHVERTPVSGMRQLDKAYNNLTGTGKQDWRKKFDTIVFDHFDDIQGLVLDELTEAGSERDPRRVMDEIQQRDWGIMGSRLKRYIRKMKALEKHKILIFAVGESKETGKLQPYLQGSLQKQLPYFCDIIAYMRIDKKGNRIFTMEPTERLVAKCRAWWLPTMKYRFKHEDTTFLTRLFQEIAAGPGSASIQRGKKGK